jgi:co-chaperonin GroES (HSP10)
MQVQEGDKVVFGTYQGVPIEVRGDKFTVLMEREVLAIL